MTLPGPTEAAPSGGAPSEAGPADASPRGAVPARPRHRTAWIAAALASALLVLAPAAWRLWTHGSVRTTVLHGDSGGRTVSALEIDAGAADVSVTPRADRQIGYRADMRWSFQQPTVEESWLGDALKLTPRCPAEDAGLRAGLGCSVRLEVTVPDGIPVKVSAASGRVDISGTAGPVDADMTSGTLNLVGLRGALRARVEAGTLNATGLTSAQADIRAASGHATAAFLAPPERVTAHVDSGRIGLSFPAATHFRVTTRAGSGRCEAEASLDDPASPRTLDLAAGSGFAGAGYSDPAG